MTGNLHLVSEETSNIESFLFYRALVECCQENELPDLVIIDGEPNHVLVKLMLLIYIKLLQIRPLLTFSLTTKFSVINWILCLI